jgi:hypothetical protein
MDAVRKAYRRALDPPGPPSSSLHRRVDALPAPRTSSPGRTGALALDWCPRRVRGRGTDSRRCKGKCHPPTLLKTSTAAAGPSRFLQPCLRDAQVRKLLTGVPDPPQAPETDLIVCEQPPPWGFRPASTERNVLPPIPSSVDLKTLKRKLRSENLVRDDGWRGFETPPKDSKDIESLVFSPLVQVLDDVLKSVLQDKTLWATLQSGQHSTLRRVPSTTFYPT